MGTGLSSHLCWTFLLPRRNDEKISQDMQHVRTSPRIKLTKALDPFRDLKTSYDTSPVAFLGQGSYGSVYRVTCKTSGCSRAVKQISKTGVSRDRLRRELQLLLELDHPHIIRLNHWFEDEYSVYLVTEYATCGDLDSHCPGSPSAEAARLYSQLVRAVRYLHDRGICHRDLKGSNCLLTGDVLKPTVKVIDFGVAMVQGPGAVNGEWLDGRVGTISHMAPEVFELGRKYGLKCDIWSAGIILFVLVTGKQPFPNGCKEEASAGHGSTWRLRRLRPRKKDGLPKHLLQLLARAGVKRELRSLLQSMLSWDPEERPEAHMVLRHPWLATRESTIDRKTLRRVLAWSMANATPLRQAVATAQAHTMQDDEVTEIRSTFQAIDSEGRGYLTESAIGEGFRKCGLEIEDEELAILFEALDREHSGQISWTDWLTAALTPDSIASERHLKLALTYIDMNNDGEVSPSELSSVLGGKSVAEAAVVRWDSDGDRKLSMDEVKAAMEGIAALKAELCQSPKVS